MKALLDNQNIYIDSHQRGDGLIIKEEYLHLHKKMNGRRFKGWEIQIYLNTEGCRVDYKKGFNSESVETKQVQNEIKQVFKNKENTKVVQLIRDLHKAIGSYYSDNQSDDLEERLIMWAKKIADGFGLKSDIKQKFVSESSGFLTLITSHEDTCGKVYYIKQDTDRRKIPVAASDNMNELYNKRKKY